MQIVTELARATSPNGYDLVVAKITSKTRPHWGRVRVAVWIPRSRDVEIGDAIDGRWTYCDGLGVQWLEVIEALEREARRQRDAVRDAKERRR